MTPATQKLVAIAKAIEPTGGFDDSNALSSVLRANPAALDEFRAAMAAFTAETVDSVYDADDHYGWIIMDAADELDLLPEDPRLFKSAADLAAVADAEVLQELTSACIVNDVAAVIALAPRGCVNELDHHGQLALAYACGNNHPDCVRVLLESGADPNRRQGDGDTPLHSCARTVSSRTIFELLRQAGGDVSLRNDSGESVLDVLDSHGRADWAAG